MKVVVYKVNTNLPLFVLFSLASKKFVPLIHASVGLQGSFVHRNLCWIPLRLQESERTAVLNFDWQGKKFCALASHLHPSHDIEAYCKSSNDVKALTEMTLDRIVLWMVHAQTIRSLWKSVQKITLLAADEHSWLFGANTEKEFCLLWYAQHVGVRSIHIWICGCWAPRGFNEPYKRRFFCNLVSD